MEQELTWWVENYPFSNTFKTIDEVIEDIKTQTEIELNENSKIFIGEVEHFNYNHAANECLDAIKECFDSVYDDWQSNLDDDQVWWEEDEKSSVHLMEEIKNYLINKTDFSVKMKAFPLYKYNFKEDKLESCL